MAVAIPIRYYKSEKLYGYSVWCPGCDEGHTFTFDIWTFDGDVERPTFSPSMLVRKLDVLRNAEEWPTICHSYLVDGVWDFLMDSQHELAGQKVPAPQHPEEDEQSA